MKITGTDLVAWADRLECRSLLPELVRRLVHGTLPPERIEVIDFPSDEGIQKHGFDGLLHALERNAFVPVGLSGWEMGCSDDPRGKAESDYKERKDKPRPEVPAATSSFVFVTPRRFNNHATWSQGKRDEGYWKDVRVIDADALAQWLDIAPAARAWLAAKLGKPHDAFELTAWWEEWSLRTTPTTTTVLVRLGREKPWDTIEARLAAPPSVMTVKVDDPDEIAAYVYASALRQPALLDRALVVDNADTLRRVIPEGRNLVIIALECPIELARKAVAQGHHVVLATTKPGPHDLALGPDDGGLRGTTANLFVAALESMKVGTTEAQRLAKESGGSFMKLRQLLGDVGELDPDLAPLLLVRAWNNNNEADVALVAEIVGLDPATIRDRVRRASTGRNRAFTSTHDSIRWSSHLGAWRSLAHLLSRDDIHRFASATTKTLLLLDPKYELEPQQRAFAQPLGKLLAHSKDLRRGLVDTLVVLATSTSLGARLDAQAAADAVIAKVMRGMTEWQHWATLERLLSGMAEAAPDVFLRELERRIEAAPDIMRRLMSVDGSLMYGGGPHSVGLVGALSTLAWSPRHLGQATVLLAKLDALDPGGNYQPRPSGALFEVFVPWIPHTMASVDVRSGALDKIARLYPKLFVRLFLAFATKQSSITGDRRPEVRPWADGWRVYATPTDRIEAYERLDLLLVDTCERLPALWSKVVTETRWLTSKGSERFFEGLAMLDVSRLDADQRETLRRSFQEALNFEVTHPDSMGAMSDESSALVRRLLATLEPDEVRARHRWLFAKGVHLPDVSKLDFEAHQRELTRRHEAAAAELVAGLDAEELWGFAEGVDYPRDLARAVARLPEGDPLALALLRRTFDSGLGAWASEFRLGIIDAIYWRDAAAFLDGMRDLEAGIFEGLTELQRVEIARVLKPEPTLWALVDGFGAQAAEHYWRVMPTLHVEDVDLDQALKRLFAAGRVWEAVDLAGMKTYRVAVQPELIVSMLRSAAASDELPESVGRREIGNSVAQLLKQLAAGGEAWRSELMSQELTWLPLVDRTYQPTALFEELSANADTFVELVCRVYRGNEVRDPNDEVARANASHAWRALDAWHTLPGLRPDGTVDDAHLTAWVKRALELVRKRGRQAIGDECIARVLACAPIGTDGHWPHEAVRDIIETVDDAAHIGAGFLVGRINLRGMTSRSFGDGGAQETALAEGFEAAAEALRTRWPRTAGILDGLANNYRRHARNEDADAMKDAIETQPEARAEEWVHVFIETARAQGRYSFTLDELIDDTGLASRDAERALQALVAKGRLTATSNEPKQWRLPEPMLPPGGQGV